MDRFSYYSAMYRFSRDWHGGQSSPEYALRYVASERGYSPGLGVREDDHATWRESDPEAADLLSAMLEDQESGGRWCRRVLATIA